MSSSDGLFTSTQSRQSRVVQMLVQVVGRDDFGFGSGLPEALRRGSLPGMLCARGQPAGGWSDGSARSARVRPPWSARWSRPGRQSSVVMPFPDEVLVREHLVAPEEALAHRFLAGSGDDAEVLDVDTRCGRPRPAWSRLRRAWRTRQSGRARTARAVEVLRHDRVLGELLAPASVTTLPSLSP